MSVAPNDFPPAPKTLVMIALGAGAAIFLGVIITAMVLAG
jgi:uncharacterized protein involved in exopolysaccharide biosynthesis